MTDAGWLRSSPIAHRGLHDGTIPENSVPAFDAAASAGYGVELDVHLSSDGKLVVMHDDDLSRMTGVAGSVTRTSSAELAELRLTGTDYGVPLLDEVLAVVAGRAPVLIEVKTGSPMNQLGPAIVEALRGYDGPVAVQSFDPRVLMWLRRQSPHMLRGQVAGSFGGTGLPVVQKALLRSMVLNAVTAPHFVAFEVDAMPSVFVSMWRSLLHAPVLVWTVRTPEQLDHAARQDANVIFEGVRPSA